jgi:hypothetical protein
MNDFTDQKHIELGSEDNGSMKSFYSDHPSVGENIERKNKKTIRMEREIKSKFANNIVGRMGMSPIR